MHELGHNACVCSPLAELCKFLTAALLLPSCRVSVQFVPPPHPCHSPTAEDLERGRSAADVEELRARMAKAASAAAEARLDLQRCYSRARPVLLQRVLNLECGVGDMLALAFMHGFMMATDQVSREVNRQL